MSLFDFIENKPDLNPETVTHPVEKEEKYSPQGNEKQWQNTGTPGIENTQCAAPGNRKPKTSEGLAHFPVAFTWLMAHINDLLAAGWTRPELFRRGKATWSASNMGVLWRDAWGKDDLNVTIGLQGEIIFTFTSGTRITVQRCFPIGKINK